MTQAEAARALGVSPRMWRYYEAGEHLLPKTVKLAGAGLDASEAAREWGGGRRPTRHYAASANCPLIVSPFEPADTWTVSPSLTAPSRISEANGFCRPRWITRFSGRAP